MQKNTIYKILWATIEDYAGLWEILWELDSSFSEKRKNENKELIKKVLRYFLELHLVTFYLNKWGEEDLKELGIDEANEILNGEKFWNAPSLNDECIKIGSTKKGEKYYYEELIIDDLIL